jgi:hypothetical protein
MNDALKTIEAFKVAEEERAAKEAEARKVETVEAIISREVLMGTVEEDKKDARVEELSAWDEMKLTGFSEALAAIPAPVDTERQFGKGISPMVKQALTIFRASIFSKYRERSI